MPVQAPVPLAGRLVPPPQTVPPAGLTTVDEPLVNGLPHRIVLDAGLELVLLLPNGLASVWREADPTDVVSESGPELAPSSVGVVPRPALRMLLQRGTETLASVPLAAGVRRLEPEGAPEVEVLVLGWDLRAGSLRGPGEFGSRIRLAWRPADRAGDVFSPPPVPESVAARLPAAFRLESGSQGAPA